VIPAKTGGFLLLGKWMFIDFQTYVLTTPGEIHGAFV
jgi:hypothetical protein